MVIAMNAHDATDVSVERVLSGVWWRQDARARRLLPPEAFFLPLPLLLASILLATLLAASYPTSSIIVRIDQILGTHTFCVP